MLLSGGATRLFTRLFTVRPEEKGRRGKKRKSRNPHLRSGVQEGRLGRLKPKITAHSCHIVSRCEIRSSEAQGRLGCGGFVPQRGKKKVVL